MLWLKLSSSHSLRIQHTLGNRAKGCPALLVCVNLFGFCFLVRVSTFKVHGVVFDLAFNYM